MESYDYDLVTIGAGSGGVRASRVAFKVYGAKVRLVGFVCRSIDINCYCVYMFCYNACLRHCGRRRGRRRRVNVMLDSTWSSVKYRPKKKRERDGECSQGVEYLLLDR